MTTFELLVLVVGILVSLCASGFALLECSKLLHSVDGYKHYIGSIIDTSKQILDHDRSVIEDVEKIKNDISMLQARLEDVNDNS